jgi:molybdopterin/thiamine biosynthesis adenylyltransferase
MTEPATARVRRYARQESWFSDQRRLDMVLAVLGGRHDPWGARGLLLMCAAAGIPQIYSDYDGASCPSGDHWLLKPHSEMVAIVNEEVRYDYIDARFPLDDLRGLVVGRLNPSVVLLINQPDQGREILAGLAQEQLQLPVVLLATGPGGFLVFRAVDPAEALEALLSAGSYPALHLGPSIELSLAAAAAGLHELLLTSFDSTGLVAYYLLADGLRISRSPHLGNLLREIAQPIEQATFAGRSVIVQGAGGLGNWALLPIALQGDPQILIFDRDVFSVSNLNRQPLATDFVGQPKATAVAEQLGRLNPLARMHGFCREIAEPDDLGALDEDSLVLSLPDNDAARCVALEAALRTGCLGATAAVSATHARVIIQQQACYQCLGLTADSAGLNLSCAAEPLPSIVTQNALASAILVSEIRQALSGRQARCLRYFGEEDVPSTGNRIAGHLTAPPCPHIQAKKRRGRSCHASTFLL